MPKNIKLGPVFWILSIICTLVFVLTGQVIIYLLLPFFVLFREPVR